MYQWLYLDGVCFEKTEERDHFESQSPHGDTIKINLKRTRMGKRGLALLGSGQGQETRDLYSSGILYYAAYSGNSLPTLGTTYCCHLQGSRIKELDSSPMKMRPIGCPETSVRY